MASTIPPIVSPTELRKNLSKYMKMANTTPLVIHDKVESKVLITQSVYNTLVDAYELYMDGVELDKLVREDSSKGILLKDLKSELLTSAV